MILKIKAIKKNLFIVILIFTTWISNRGFGQNKIDFIVDTIYSNFVNIENKFLLFGKNNEKSLIVCEDYIKDHYPVSGILENRFIQDKILLKNKNKWYLTDNNFNIDFNKYFDFKHCQLVCKGYYPYLFYRQNDSIFIYNIEKQEKKFVTIKGIISIENSRYALIKRKNGKKTIYYTYDIENSKITQLPDGFVIPDASNNWFVVETFPLEDYGALVVNENTNKKIADKSENYSIYVNKDFLFLFGNPTKPLKFFYKNNRIKIPSNIIRINEIDDKGFIYAINKKGKYGVLDKDLNIILPFEYDNIESGLYNDVLQGYFYRNYIMAKKNKYIYLYNENLGLAFKGEYDEIRILDDNRISAKKSGRTKIVDFNNKTIIPFSFIGENIYAVKEDWGIKYILLTPFTFFSYNGEKIASFENNDNYFFPDFWAGLSQRSNPNMLKLFNKEQVKKLNKYDLWIYNDISKKELYRMNRKNKLYIVDHNLNKIAGPFQKLIRIGSSNKYVIKTYGKHVGVIEVKM